MKIMIKALTKKALLFLSTPLLAEIEIVITEGMDNARPVAVLPFSWQGINGSQTSQDVAAVIASDLKTTMCSMFKVIPN